VLRDISVSFGGKIILNSINLEIGAGELVALLGPSGCGKSTLLKTIAGLFTPQSGDVFIHGQNVSNQPASMRGAVIVFQDLRLFPNMTVEENIAFPLKIRGVSKVDRHRQAQKLIAGIRLEGLGERKISEMSGGQLQRVALARALAAEPKILLLDEPFSSLDENLRQEMRRLVLDLRREYEMTILLVTHDQQEAFLMADRIAVMLDGKIIQYDTPRNIYQGPANKTVADYLGGGNYIQGDVRNGRFHSAIVNFSVQKPAAGISPCFVPLPLRR
jgi:putative spermidine/putrescine transport system ATP-binding protein